MTTEPLANPSSENPDNSEIKIETSSSRLSNEEISEQYPWAVSKLNEEGSSEAEIEEAIKSLETMGEQGEDKAWMALGHYYRTINEGEQINKGISSYRKAAENNFSEALLMLGKCYYRGFGVEKDYSQAFNYFKRAATQGSVDANFYQGICYCKGHGVGKNFPLAADSFSKKYGPSFIDEIIAFFQTKNSDSDAKDRDETSLRDAEIQLMLGHCYFHGIAKVDRNLEKALESLEKAANYGESSASSMLNLIGVQIQDDKLADRAFKAADKLEVTTPSDRPSSDPITDALSLTTFPINKTDIQIAIRRYHISKGFFRKASKLSAAPIQELESLLQNDSYFDREQMNAAGFNTLINILLSTTQGKQSHAVLAKIRGKLEKKYPCYEKIKELKLLDSIDASKLYTLSDEILTALLSAGDCLGKTKPSILNPDNFKLLYDSAFDENIRVRLKFILTLHGANMLNLENLKEIFAPIPEEIAQRIEGFSSAVEQCEIPLPAFLFGVPGAGTYKISNSDIELGKNGFIQDVPRGNSPARLMLINKSPPPALLFSAFKQDHKKNANVVQTKKNQLEKKYDEEKKLFQADEYTQGVLDLKSAKNHAAIQYVIDHLGEDGADELFLTYGQNYFSTIGILMTPFIRYKFKDEFLPPPKVESTVTNIKMAGEHLHVTCWNNKFIAQIPDDQGVEEKPAFPNTASNVIHEMQLVINPSKQNSDERYQFIQSIRTDSIVLARELFNSFCVNRLKQFQAEAKEFKSLGDEREHERYLIDVYTYFSTADKGVLDLNGLLECLKTLKEIPDDEQLTDLTFGYMYNNRKRSELLIKANALLESLSSSEVSRYRRVQDIIHLLRFKNSELSKIYFKLRQGKDENFTILNSLKSYHQKLLEWEELITRINNRQEISDNLTDGVSTSRDDSTTSVPSSSSFSGSASSSCSTFFSSRNTSHQLPETPTFLNPLQVPRLSFILKDPADDGVDESHKIDHP